MVILAPIDLRQKHPGFAGQVASRRSARPCLLPPSGSMDPLKKVEPIFAAPRSPGGRLRGKGNGSDLNSQEGASKGAQAQGHSDAWTARRACDAPRLLFDAGRSCLRSRKPQAPGPSVTGNLRAQPG